MKLAKHALIHIATYVVDIVQNVVWMDLKDTCANNVCRMSYVVLLSNTFSLKWNRTNVCACACACVRARGCVCVCVCVTHKHLISC